MAGFIQFMRCEASDELLRHPNAFTLLALIAQRARRDVPLINPYGLQVGEALIGDSAAVGLTRQEFRTALSKLENWGLVSTRTTNKGTIASLCNSAIYDINTPEIGQPAINQQATGQRQKNNQQPNQQSTSKTVCESGFYEDITNTGNQQPNQQSTNQSPEVSQNSTTNKKEERRSKEVSSSLRSEDAATAAAPEKKIEAEPQVENPGEAQTPPPVAKPPRGTKRKAELTGLLADLLNPGGLAHRVQTMKEPFTQAEADALVSKYGIAAARNIVQEMANYAKLTTNSVSANLTAQKWLSKRTTPTPALHAIASNGAQQNRYHTSRHPGGFGNFADTLRRAPGPAAQPLGIAATGGPADPVLGPPR